MRMLTVRQPWADQIVAGEKRVENRIWRPPGTLRIGIHAGAWRPRDGVREYDLGAVLGTVMIGSFHAADDPECVCTAEEGAMSATEFDAHLRARPGRPRVLWHWRLASPRRFVTPIPRVRGALGLWTPTPTVAHLIEIAEVTR